jgi:exodeoxyribonuclease VII small subunit
LSEQPEGLDQVLDRLEKQIARLADGSAPLDEVVDAHEEAQRLIDEAQVRLRELMARLDAEAKG